VGLGEGHGPANEHGIEGRDPVLHLEVFEQEICRPASAAATSTRVIPATTIVLPVPGSANALTQSLPVSVR
jgi:hypothetical protein